MTSSSGRSLKFVRTSSPCSPRRRKYCSIMSSSAWPFSPVTALRMRPFSWASSQKEVPGYAVVKKNTSGLRPTFLQNSTVSRTVSPVSPGEPIMNEQSA